VKLGKAPYLTILPAHHADPSTVGAMSITLDWLDYKLKGKKETVRAKPVSFVINPTKETVETDSWPPPTSDLTFFLHPQGKIGEEALAEGNQDIYKYIYDPLSPTPILGGNMLENGGALDNFNFLTERRDAYKDVLLFTGSPFSNDTTITGAVRAILFVSSSLSHTDFFVRLLDYNPKKNTSFNICDGFVRLPKVEITPDGNNVLKVTVETIPTAYKFQQGHAIMLQVSSGAHPHYSRNPGTGEHISVATKFVKADQQLHVSSVYPSHIVLPQYSN